MLRLFVRDNTDGHVHEYGTNPHDALILQEDGSLHYENMQNCTGTKYPKEGYSFCTADGTIPQWDMVNGVEPYIDIAGEYYAERSKTNANNQRNQAVHRAVTAEVLRSAEHSQADAAGLGAGAEAMP